MRGEKVPARMTEGPILTRLIVFTIPLMLGNLFQQLYNVADSVIVGNCLGENALAAVASSSALIMMLVGMFNGIALGAGVIVARYYGAKDEMHMKQAVHTASAFALTAGVAMTVVSVPLSKQILLWMGTPDQVLPESTRYLAAYFMGFLPSIVYNVAVGILQAVGDSYHPLIYLIVSSVINIILDLIFNGALHLGVEFAGYATVISQCISAVLAVNRLLHSQQPIRVVPSMIRFHGSVFREIIHTGIPSGVQNSIISLANVVVQANVNVFGSYAMAGCGAYSKIEGFAALPISCFSMALTTFVSQNLGAGQYDRARKGIRVGCACSAILAEAIGITIFFTAPFLIGLFNRNPEVIAYGTRRAQIVGFFYFLMAFSHGIAGSMRGAGKATVPMLVMMICWCFFRVTYIEIVTMFINKIDVIFYAYPITWTMSSVVFLIYYLRADWAHGFEKKNK